MNIHWNDQSTVSPKNDIDLLINGAYMGWVDRRGDNPDKLRVCCMWMTTPPDHRIDSGVLIPTDYPEGVEFDTVDEAKQALLEPAIVMAIGGWRGR